MSDSTAGYTRSHGYRPANDAQPIGWREFIGQVWKERGLMLVVFMVIFAIGASVAMLQKPKYPANSSILVRLGDEYVYQPTVGDAGKGFVPATPEQLMQSEVEILASSTLKERVITKVGIARIDPELGQKYANLDGDDEQDAAERRFLMGEAVHKLNAGLEVEPAASTPVIRMTYSHANPNVAATVLNRLIDEYLAYRREVLQGVTTPLIAAQRQAFEDRLRTAQEDLEAFLSANNIGDFEAERDANADLYAQVLDERYRVQAQRRQIEARREALRNRLEQVSPEVNLFVDDSSREELLQLKIEREDLLARYEPGSSQVQNIEKRINQLERFILSGGAEGQGARRVGVNPVHQTLQTDFLQAEADAVSLQAREQALTSQLARLSSRQLEMQKLATEYQKLSREASVLEANAQAFAEREEQTRAAREIAEKVTDNIRVIERPVTPTRPTDLRIPILLLSLIFAAMTAFVVGALTVLLRQPAIMSRPTSSDGGVGPARGVTPPPPPPPTKVADMPVLAVVPRKQPYL